MTSGSGLNPDAGIPMTDCGSWLPEEMPMSDQLFSGITTFRHLYMIFQYHITRLSQSASVYGRAREVTFELFTTCSLDVYCMHGYLSPPPTLAVWTCRMPECRNVRHPVRPVPAASTSMPMPSYGIYAL